MNRLMQTASVLSFAAALAAAPVVAVAQQQTTETQAEQAVEGAAQEVEEAAGEATEAAGEAAEEAEQAVEETAQEAEQAVEGTTEATEEKADAIEEQADAVEEQAEEQADAVEEQSEEQAEAIEQQGEEQADALEEQADVVEEVEVVEGEEPVEEVPGAIVMQDENSILVNDLIGATIYNAAGETVGEVDDAILSLDGTVEGVVIGVGGFLGIGEKNVAVEMAQISVQTDEDGDPQLVLDTTREALEAAPEFVTVEDQQREAQATTATMPPAGGTAPAAGGVAPAPAGQAPAEGGTAAPAQN